MNPSTLASPATTTAVLDETFKESADEIALDEALVESFPASDPVAIDTGPAVKLGNSLTASARTEFSLVRQQ